MAKKILSVFVAVLMIASMAVMAIPTASAASPSFSGGTIYWECPWDVAQIAYCHVYGSDGTALYDWQTKNEKMTKVEGNKWSYEVPAGQYDEIIFSIDTGAQTFDLVMTDDNIGDTAVTDTNTMIENPMDSNKTAAKTTWKSGKNGPHLGITSIGNLVGEVLCPTESGATMVANYIKNYLTVNPDTVTSEILAGLISAAGTTADDVFAALQADPEFPTLPMSEEDPTLQIDTAKKLLGIGGSSGSDEPASSNSGDNNNSSNGGTTSNTSSTSSTSSTRSNTSTTSTTSSGTTTTGDSTPFVVLGIVLVAALGVAVVAAKKKVAE